jgi:hypothetical protein
MKNGSFLEMCRTDREDKIVSATYKRLNGRIAKRFLTPIVECLDLDRQLEIKVVNRDSVLKYCCLSQYVKLDAQGNFLMMENIYAKVIMGEAKLGKYLSVTRDSLREVLTVVEGKVLEYPVCLVNTTDVLEVKDDRLASSYYNTLIICI